MAAEALARIGPAAKAASGIIEGWIQEARERVANAKTTKARQSAEARIKKLEGILRRTSPPALPPKKRKKK